MSAFEFRSLDEEIAYQMAKGFYRDTIELSTLHAWANERRARLDAANAEIERLQQRLAVSGNYIANLETAPTFEEKCK